MENRDGENSGIYSDEEQVEEEVPVQKPKSLLKVNLISQTFLLLTLKAFGPLIYSIFLIRYNSLQQFQVNNFDVTMTFLLIWLASVYYVKECRECSRYSPQNYLLFLSVMVCESYLIGLWISKSLLKSDGRFQLVFLATLLLLFLYLSGVIFASGFDLSIASWILSILLFTVTAALIYRYYYNFSVLTSSLSFIFLFIFSIYLLYDCNLMAFEKRYNLDSDDCLVGACILYFDWFFLLFYLMGVGKSKQQQQPMPVVIEQAQDQQNQESEIIS